ncbi:MAG: hypothetical protein ACTSVR_03240 [Candidatus Thorarchaeota archaeon]
MVKMDALKRKEIEKLKQKPISYLEEMIAVRCREIERALLNNRFTDADGLLMQAKLFAWARREKLKEMKK